MPSAWHTNPLHQQQPPRTSTWPLAPLAAAAASAAFLLQQHSPHQHSAWHTLCSLLLLLINNDNSSSSSSSSSSPTSGGTAHLQGDEYSSMHRPHARAEHEGSADMAGSRNAGSPHPMASNNSVASRASATAGASPAPPASVALHSFSSQGIKFVNGLEAQQEGVTPEAGAGATALTSEQLRPFEGTWLLVSWGPAWRGQINSCLHGVYHGGMSRTACQGPSLLCPFCPILPQPCPLACLNCPNRTLPCGTSHTCPACPAFVLNAQSEHGRMDSFFDLFRVPGLLRWAAGRIRGYKLEVGRTRLVVGGHWPAALGGWQCMYSVGWGGDLWRTQQRCTWGVCGCEHAACGYSTCMRVERLKQANAPS